MRPYMYAGYNNTNATAMPIGYRAPISYATQTLNYPSSGISPAYRSEYPGLSAITRMPVVPPSQAYPTNPNGSNPTQPTGNNNEFRNSFASNHHLNGLINEKGTKYKLSKIYRIQKTKPDLHKDNVSEDDFKIAPPPRIPIVPNQQPVVVVPPPPPLRQKTPSSESSYSGCSTCSHCSTCSDCSCTECRSKEKGVFYDDCEACRLERERERTKQQNRK